MHPGSGLADSFVGSVTVGERGQVVIPADARDKCNITPGDKLLCFVHPAGAGVILVRVDELARMAEDLQRVNSQVYGGNGSSEEGQAE